VSYADPAVDAGLRDVRAGVAFNVPVAGLAIEIRFDQGLLLRMALLIPDLLKRIPRNIYVAYFGLSLMLSLTILKSWPMNDVRPVSFLLRPMSIITCIAARTYETVFIAIFIYVLFTAIFFLGLIMARSPSRAWSFSGIVIACATWLAAGYFGFLMQVLAHG
jgi:hypothetical protein